MGGVIIGIGASFLLQFMQRRWSLDDQKREFLRNRLREQSDILERFTGLLLKSRSDVLYTKITDEDNKRLLNDLWDFGTKIDLTFDKHLIQIYNEEFIPLFQGKLVTEFDNEKISLTLNKMKMRINALIEETYY
jgi:hypothetical protein